MTKGQIVTVQFYGGTNGPRRVVADKGSVVVICHEDEYQAALAEQREPDGVGFPRENVSEGAQ